MKNIYHSDIYQFNTPVSSYWEDHSSENLNLDKLNSREIGLRVTTINEDNIWLRYNNDRIVIKLIQNPLKNIFYDYHIKKIKEAKVI